MPVSRLGRTLTHEHFSLDFDCFYKPPPAHLNEHFTAESIRLDTCGFVRQYPYASRYNIRFCDEDTHTNVLDDVRLYAKWGGGTIVENSSHGLQRNLAFMQNVASETGVNVIAGTGHYVHSVQPASDLLLGVEEMVDLYTRELTVGCKAGAENGDAIRCGFVGEVGSVWPIHDFEKRSIQATGIVQATLNCPVSFHPGRVSAAPFEIVRLYLEAGGRADKCVMSHLDRTILDLDELLEFAKTGVYCQFDLFGTECSYYQLNPIVDMPSDAERMKHIVALCAHGLEDRILMSHDVHTKHRLVS